MLLIIVFKTKDNSLIVKLLMYVKVLGHLIGMLTSKFSDHELPQDMTLIHFILIPSIILIKELLEEIIVVEGNILNLIFYKEVNREYLKQIKYRENLSIFKTYGGFRLYAVDGLKLSFDNNKELRKDFKVKKNTLRYTQPSEAKFSAIMDLLNGYIIDAELGNFRQSKKRLI